MEYDFERFVEDYINRTLCNSRLINEAKEKNAESVYEVTHLLNSFFGVLIVPFEAFNINKNIYHSNNEKEKQKEKIRNDELLDEMQKSEAYKEISLVIERLISSKRYVHNYNLSNKHHDLGRDKVYVFLERLRNSLSHGGNEGLSFLPICDIESKDALKNKLTHVIFHDEWRKSESYIKLSIDEIYDLYDLISSLFMDINQKHAFTIDEYQARVQKAEEYLKNGLPCSNSSKDNEGKSNNGFTY